MRRKETDGRRADNILVSNYFQAHLNLMLQKLQDDNPYGRTFAYLIARALLGRLTGEQRIETGHRVLRAMKLGSLEGVGESMRGTEDVGTVSTYSSVPRRSL